MKTKTKKAEITFAAQALAARVEDFAAGQEPARERTMKLPPPVKPIPAKLVEKRLASSGEEVVSPVRVLRSPRHAASVFVRRAICR